MAVKSAKKKKALSVDMSGVESGGRAVPDGNYTAFITECAEKEGESSGEPYLACKWKITSGKAKGATVYDNISLQPQALWRFKTMLECMEVDVPDGEMDIDTDDFMGEDHAIEIEVTNEKYKGQNKPRITGFGGAPTEGESEDSDKDDDTDKEDDDSDKEEEKPAKKNPVKAEKEEERVGKPAKIKEGSKVTFTDDDDNTVKGTVIEVDGKKAKVEDRKGNEWEIDVSDLELV